ncbi:MAG: hypothetical protein IPH18_02030 [Chitinophagaceae bacterium]|nr:hypothetical protein [Chitinophagaceae bacterium]
MFTKYNINDTDIFNLSDFPKVEREMNNMLIRIANTPENNKAEIIISFLKDHSLKNEWFAVNPELARLISGRYFTTSHLECLFESCQKNKHFTREYEDCIRKAIAAQR